MLSNTVKFILLFAFISNCSSKKLVISGDIENEISTIKIEKSNKIINTIDGFEINAEFVSSEEINEITKSAFKRFDVFDSKLSNISEEFFYFSRVENDMRDKFYRELFDNLDEDRLKYGDDIIVDIKRKITDKNYGISSFGLEYYTDSQSSYLYNPYYVNNKHLTVARVEVVNKSDSIQELKLRSFQLQTNSELLNPLSINDLEPLLSEFAIINAKRLNMNETLKLAPKQKIQTYISFPTIDYNNNTLKLQYLGENNKYYEEEFFSTLTIESEKIPYQTFKLTDVYKGGMPIFCIKFSQDQDYKVLKSNTFSVPDSMLGQEIEIFVLTIFDSKDLVYSKFIKKLSPDNSVLKIKKIRW